LTSASPVHALKYSNTCSLPDSITWISRRWNLFGSASWPSYSASL
jgi:hypothetical protein